MAILTLLSHIKIYCVKALDTFTLLLPLCLSDLRTHLQQT